MTAEAVVMNKSAVAMAADSAVTISSGRQGSKTFETVNKLFELIKGRPVGFMIYANAEINGMPWETVLKSFRDANRDLSLPYLEDYVDSFSEYIKDNRDMVGPASEVRLVIDKAYNALTDIFEYVFERQESCVTNTGRLVMTRVSSLVTEAIDRAEARYEPIHDGPWTDAVGPKQIRETFGQAIDMLVGELFGEWRLKKSIRNRLSNIAISYITKVVPDPAASGVVIAGFGERDYFPKMHSVRVRGMLRNSVLSYGHEDVAIEQNYAGHLETFAEDEEARAYISGVNSAVRKKIVEYWRGWMTDSRTEIASTLSRFGNLTAAEKTEVEEAMSKITSDRLHEFMHHMQDHEDSTFVAPFLESISFLPKDELAVLAESLVNLTSLKQRMDVQSVATVGGAIDVALISRGDGFVWLKRKHYFSSELNPSWHMTHRGTLQ
ncbi:hypothetical protein ACFQS1_29690 [Paractinoplanes rhizophilus]|uniref:Uncharacterized protein n=1 Tax=Paractinoplanes rhizophilus TaxID=1416877 RepID=A0ABW2HZ86_9ACTN